MENTLADEVLSINAIYGDGTLVAHSSEPHLYLFRLPLLPDASFKLFFPVEYPRSPPRILGTETLGSGKIKAGQGRTLVEQISDSLRKAYQPGQCCIYDLIEECTTITLQVADENERVREVDARTKEEGDAEQRHNHSKLSSNNIAAPPQTSHDTLLDNISSIPAWTASNPITEKKSVFIARVATVHSPAQAKSYLDHLLASDKKVARATHNINAWRIRSIASTAAGGADGTNANSKNVANEITYQDYDDDGETAAGTRLLHLLQLMDAWNVIVVVSRWYGGVHLGPDRFRIINAVAREALVRADVPAGSNCRLGSGNDAGAGLGRKGRKG